MGEKCTIAAEKIRAKHQPEQAGPQYNSFATKLASYIDADGMR